MHDFHRSFLQHLFGASALSEPEAIRQFGVLAKEYATDLRTTPFRHYANHASVTKTTVDECVAVINGELDFFALKVTKTHCAADGVFYYGVVNLSNDEHAQKATSLTPSQVAFFAKVKAAIMDAGEGEAQGGAIERMQAENLVQGIPQLDHGTATRTLQHLIDHRWLLESRKTGTDGDDEFRLGPRSALQMQYDS